MKIANLDWSKDYDQFLNYLYSIKDVKYRDFSKKITPGEFEMIGIRIPYLKTIAKKIYKNTDYKSFLKIDDNNTFELIMLKGLVIANIKDSNEFKYYFNYFLPYINNWAICDIFLAASKTIKKNEEYYFKESCRLIKLNDEFKNRVGFVLLLDYFVSDKYIDRILDITNGYKSDKYYANMSLAWLLSVCYIKYPEKMKKYLQNCNLNRDVIKKSIQKIRDSYRVSREDKEQLKKLITF